MAVLKIDIHVHTHHSDSTGSVAEVIETAKRRGLDGVAITDHHTLRGVEEALAMQHGLVIVPGEEVETDRGDILALGVRKVIPRGLPIREAIRQVHSQRGLVVVPHPTIPFFGKLKESDFGRLPIDGLEVFSAIAPLANHYARKNMDLARWLGLPVLAGSDSHFPETVGDAYTIIYARGYDLPNILGAIRQGRTRLGCRPSKLTFKFRMIISLLR
ncbi:MAG: PHP domain-containing protein [Candidatus Bathyarchaeia archaeon]